jgi:hypothetical protein
VNVASRIADLADASDVLTTEETMQQVEGVEVDWVRIGPTAGGFREARDALPSGPSHGGVSRGPGLGRDGSAPMVGAEEVREQ